MQFSVSPPRIRAYSQSSAKATAASGAFSPVRYYRDGRAHRSDADDDLHASILNQNPIEDVETANHPAPTLSPSFQPLVRRSGASTLKPAL